jgi:RND family efflux transporter MFP subunit
MPRFSSRLITLPILAAAIAFVLGCRGGTPPPPNFPPPQVTVARPLIKNIQHYLEYNGFLDAVETVQIRARVKGFLNQIEFKEGDEVKKDELLYQIDPREYKAAVAKSKADIAKAQADIANADAQIKLGEAELDRADRAYKGSVAAKTDLDKAVAQLAAYKAQRETAAASVDAAKASLQTAQLDLDYTTILAPISGRISRTLVTKGNLVGQNESTLLTTIVSVDPLYVYFDVPERDLVEHLRTLQEKPGSLSDTTQKLFVGVATEDGYPHEGRINFRENHVENGTGTIRLRGQIDNPLLHASNTNERLLYPGLYARVKVPIGKDLPLPVIPEEALMTGQEGRFVYIIGPENKVEKRAVKVGPQYWAAPSPGSPPQPGWTLRNPKPPAPDEQKPGAPPVPAVIQLQSIVAIDEGLKGDERIIVNGLQKARPGAPVSPDEWTLNAPSAAPVSDKK